MGAELMSKRSNSNNNNANANAKKARHHASPAAHERPDEAAKARGGRETGAGFDNKARNAADRFDREGAQASHGAHAHAGAGGDADRDRDRDRDRERAAAARAGAGAGGGANAARDEARAKTRDR